MPNAETVHKSVLLDESIAFLRPESGGVFVDATLGLGGHSEAILAASPDTRVIGIDQDADALKVARERLAGFGDRAVLVQANFSELRRVIDDAKLGDPDGIIADLGVSSLQLDSESRGFSFRFDSELDMRMNPSAGGETAAEMLERLDHEELADIIYRYGEERASRKIARWIIEKRDAGTPITTTFELAELVKRAVRMNPKERTHPATRTFQALRIAVNGELDILDRLILDSVDVLKTNGVLAVVTFHSLEDRIVKRAFQRLSGKCECPPRIPQCQCGAAKRVEILTRKPVLPSETEQRDNPRSRSAKLRVCRSCNNLEDLIMNQNNRRKSSGSRRKTAKRTRGWQTYLLMAICLFMLVAGFFFAARQHFSSMDYGMRNSKLRKQIDELEAEKRRLLLAREVSMSPAEIKKAAVKAQLTPPAEAAPASIELASATAPKAKAETKELSDTKTLVVKTSAVTAAAATKVAAVYRKPEVSEKAIRKAGLAE